ncbi:hypothetical protein M431DRAFT_350229 [Trichoderma harzianum CBS 226.95]|uniref:Uncharacterized protein n=1 Tax=Trichoderma harzianum CBS 226.95 TaxID=983964 RepID=A0A2T4AL61_TRIHA|nr:hypothetical protein M431DRAFT_350229 [Trichoderma harzianum CBS 226.95]PTB57797.1 hypothetical protein M431DRAFT_350229 [Trichoderma harzianum CBS 226.95]
MLYDTSNHPFSPPSSSGGVSFFRMRGLYRTTIISAATPSCVCLSNKRLHVASTRWMDPAELLIGGLEERCLRPSIWPVKRIYLQPVRISVVDASWPCNPYPANQAPGPLDISPSQMSLFFPF